MRIGFARIEVRTAAGVLIRRRELNGTSEESIELPHGEYVAVIEDENGNVQRRTVTLGPGGAVITVP